MGDVHHRWDMVHQKAISPIDPSLQGHVAANAMLLTRDATEKQLAPTDIHREED